MDSDVRFWEKVHLATNGCWMWTGAKNNQGYAMFRASGKAVLGHRWLFQRLGGSIPEGLELDHLCCTPLCVNPSHLEPVPHRVNNERGAHNWHPTQCPKGHVYNEANTIRRKDGSRVCKACKDTAKRVWRVKRRQWISLNLEKAAAKEATRKL